MKKAEKKNELRIIKLFFTRSVTCGHLCLLNSELFLFGVPGFYHLHLTPVWLLAAQAVETDSKPSYQEGGVDMVSGYGP